MHKDIKAFKGRYCGCFINKKNSSLIIFNDQLGLYDIFYYFENGSIILSDKFSKILRIKEFGREDLDLVAMAEFLLCTHVLRERTFIKSVKLLPIATMKSFDLVTDAIESLTYWQYSFITNSYFNKKDALNGVDHLFKQSMSRIAALNPDKSFNQRICHRTCHPRSPLQRRYEIDTAISALLQFDRGSGTRSSVCVEVKELGYWSFGVVVLSEVGIAAS